MGQIKYQKKIAPFGPEKCSTFCSSKWTKVADSSSLKVEQSCNLTCNQNCNFGSLSNFSNLQLRSILKRKKFDHSCICEVTPTRDSELLQTLF